MGDPTNPAGTATPAQAAAIDPIELSRRVQKKLMVWSTFSVLIGSFPLILNMLILFTQNKPIAFFDLFSHGELLLISTAISGAAMGDMIYNRRFDRVRDVGFICICFVIILLAVSWFASLGIGGKATNIVGFGAISLVLFIATVLVSGNCEAIVEVPSAI